MTIIQRYPISLIDFAKVIEGNYFYIDKTEYVCDIARKYNAVFIRRPRKFGKSLLASTFRYYFEGRKELFHGLAAEYKEKDWEAHAVIFLDLTDCLWLTGRNLELNLDRKLYAYEQEYGRSGEGLRERMCHIINRAYETTGKGVVVIIDGFDAAMIQLLNNQKELLNTYGIMNELLAPLKTCSKLLRFILITAKTKYTSDCVLSKMKNLTDLSADDAYAHICGFTQAELDESASDGVSKLSDYTGIPLKSLKKELREQYTGYHFTRRSDDLYNPFSIIKCLSNKVMAPFWYESGVPEYITEMLNLKPCDMLELESLMASEKEFSAALDEGVDIVPFLFQMGFVTKKSYNDIYQKYVLGFPNSEVRIGFLKYMLESHHESYESINSKSIRELRGKFLDNDLGEAMQIFEEIIRSIPYAKNVRVEKHYQTIVYLLFTLIGEFLPTEASTSEGRIDATVRTPSHIYLFDFKVDKSADVAMQQIEHKYNPNAFICDRHIITKVGVSIDSKTHSIAEWTTVEERKIME